MKEWFYVKDGQPVGPIEKEELRNKRRKLICT